MGNAEYMGDGTTDTLDTESTDSVDHVSVCSILTADCFDADEQLAHQPQGDASQPEQIFPHPPEFFAAPQSDASCPIPQEFAPLHQPRPSGRSFKDKFKTNLKKKAV